MAELMNTGAGLAPAGDPGAGDPGADLAPTEHAATLAAKSAAELAGLEPRDVQMLDIWSRGHDNCGVAMALNVSIETVKYSAKMIFKKMYAANRTEACVIAVSRGIIQPRSEL
jgi:DNA-binding NarL/FixJ family response regulator